MAGRITCCPDSFYASRRTSGFSLVELLVVIGIIAVLVGVLLAALPGVVERSRRTACIASLQDVGRTLLVRTNESGGYLPLAGTLRLDPPPVTGGGIAAAVGDPRRTRYQYLRTNDGFNPFSFGELLVTLPVSLAETAGTGDVPDTYADLTAWGQSGDAGRATEAWRCTSRVEGSVPPETVALQTPGMTAHYLTMIPFDYGFNEYVLGFDVADRNRPLRGLLARVRSPSQVLLMADHDDGYGRNVVSWNVRDADARTAEPVPFAQSTGPRIGGNRHGGRANALFVDGHAELLAPDAAGVLLRP